MSEKIDDRKLEEVTGGADAQGKPYYNVFCSRCSTAVGKFATLDEAKACCEGRCNTRCESCGAVGHFTIKLVLA